MSECFVKQFLEIVLLMLEIWNVPASNIHYKTNYKRKMFDKQSHIRQSNGRQLTANDKTAGSIPHGKTLFYFYFYKLICSVYNMYSIIYVVL